MSDLISREKAVQGVRELFSMGDCYCDELSIVGMLNGLSSIEPEQKKGKWTKTDIYDEQYGYLNECPYCKKLEWGGNFCSNCGARME